MLFHWLWILATIDCFILRVIFIFFLYFKSFYSSSSFSVKFHSKLMNKTVFLLYIHSPFHRSSLFSHLKKCSSRTMTNFNMENKERLLFILPTYVFYQVFSYCNFLVLICRSFFPLFVLHALPFIFFICVFFSFFIVH